MLRAMRVRPSLIMALCGVGLSLSSGCAYGEVRQVIRAQFASELNCPEVVLKKRALWYLYDNDNQYNVTGCGVVRTYTCKNVSGLVSYDKPACTWVNGNSDAPEAAKDNPDDTAGGDVAPAAEEAPKPAAPKSKPAAAPSKAAPKADDEDL
jgi:hypothetical protein